MGHRQKLLLKKDSLYAKKIKSRIVLIGALAQIQKAFSKK